MGNELTIPISTDIETMIWNFGKLHPRNYHVSKHDGSFSVDVKGHLKFDFDKNKLVISLGVN